MRKADGPAPTCADPPTGRPARTFGYARVSTDDQSLALQLDALRKVGVDEVFEDRTSGKAASRPASTACCRSCAGVIRWRSGSSTGWAGALHGAQIMLPMPSVGATENLVLAAVLAKGRTIIGNAAREPEIADLLLCLRAMGAHVEGIGTDVLTIEGGCR